MDAEHLLTLLTDPAAPPRGIKVEGETITGEFDWAWQTLPVPLELVDCVIDHPIILDHTQMAALNLMGCRLPRLSAGDSTITDMLRVRNCEVEGVVIVDWGHFAGNLFAAGAQLINPAAHSLEAVGAEVAGDVFFSNGFRSEGGLIMSRISIGGEFNCEGVTFDQAEGNRAINASHAEIRGKVALNAVDLVVDDSIFLRPRFVSNGQVRLNRTRIGGTLDCTGGTFTNDGREALFARSMVVGAGVDLSKGFVANGDVTTVDSQITGELDCTEGVFNGDSNGCADRRITHLSPTSNWRPCTGPVARMRR